MKKIVKDVLFGDEREKGYCERPPYSQTTYTQETVVAAPVVSSAVATSTVTAPAVVEHREKAPVVQEVIKPGLREEIQPVIHRDREQLEIREELQPIYEKTVRPTIVEQMELAPEMKPEVRLGAAPIIAEGPRSSTFVEAEQREKFVKAPIVEETVHKKIVEEVQPVIHREVLAPKVIQEVQPIYEKIVEAPQVKYETLPAQYRGETVMTSGATLMSAPAATTTATSVPIHTLPSSATGTREVFIEEKTTTTTTTNVAPGTFRSF